MTNTVALNNNPKKIGLVTLVILAFYTVSGGPFGIEDIVRAGGPYYALLGFVLLLIWAVPEALITVELSTALPEASGSVAWYKCIVIFLSIIIIYISQGNNSIW